MDSTFASRVEKVADELADLLRRKNEAYGDSFHQQWQKYGLVSALIRMDDKMARLQNLSKSGEWEANGESIRDTLMDLAGYALLSVMESDDAKRYGNDAE